MSLKGKSFNSVKCLNETTSRKIYSANSVSSVHSAVKELLENALDAKATNVEIKLTDFGLRKIEVTDNGCGINPNDVAVMAKPHFTSKISNHDDMYEVTTFGFRGEALGSLCTLSQMTVITRTKSMPCSITSVLDSDGSVKKISNSSFPKGTTILLENLFYNYPVRKQTYKSLKKKKEELNKVENFIKHYAILHPGVRIALYHCDSLIFQKPAVLDAKSAIIHVWGASVCSSMQYRTVSDENNEIIVEAFLPRSDYNLAVTSRTTSDSILLSINGRPAKIPDISKLIQHYFLAAVAAEVTQRRNFPLSFISIRLPQAQVDINLDSEKMVFFMQCHGLVVSLITRMLSKFYSTEVTQNSEAEPKTNKDKPNFSFTCAMATQENVIHNLGSCAPSACLSKASTIPVSDSVITTDASTLVEEITRETLVPQKSDCVESLKLDDVTNETQQSLITRMDQGNTLTNNKPILSDCARSSDFSEEQFVSNFIHKKILSPCEIEDEIDKNAKYEDLRKKTNCVEFPERNNNNHGACFSSNLQHQSSDEVTASGSPSIVSINSSLCDKETVGAINESIHSIVKKTDTTRIDNNESLNEFVLTLDVEGYQESSNNVEGDTNTHISCSENFLDEERNPSSPISDGELNCSVISQSTEEFTKILDKDSSDLSVSPSGSWSRGNIKGTYNKILEPSKIIGARSSKKMKRQSAGTSPADGAPKVKRTIKDMFLSESRRKKDLSPFAKFAEKNQHIVQDNPEASTSTIAELILSKWHALTEKERELYGSGFPTLANAESFKSEDFESDEIFKVIRNETKTKDLTFSVAKLKEIFAERKARKNKRNSTDSETMEVIGESSGCWFGLLSGVEIFAFHLPKLQECVLYNSLCMTYKLPLVVLRKAVSIDFYRMERLSLLRDVLNALHADKHGEMDPFEYVTDPRLTWNGFFVRRTGNRGKESMAEIWQMSEKLSSYGVKDLIEILQSIAEKPNVSLQESRPTKLLLFLKDEAKRISKNLPKKVTFTHLQELIKSYKDVYHSFSLNRDKIDLNVMIRVSLLTAN